MSDATITQYAQPLFYFFLRKTGDPTAAEDLAADVLLAALTALRGGRAITHLHAWVWQVARRRYAAWAAQKRHRRENEAAPDEVDSIPSPGDPLDDTLRLPEEPEKSTTGMWIELR